MKKKKRYDGIVYSTNPDFNYSIEDNEAVEKLKPAEQDIRVCRDKKSRGGKTVTLIKGIVGSNDDLKILEKNLKARCGVGGSSKNGEILIQGDLVEKIIDILKSQGYRVKRSGG